MVKIAQVNVHMDKLLLKMDVNVQVDLFGVGIVVVLNIIAFQLKYGMDSNVFLKINVLLDIFGTDKFVFLLETLTVALAVLIGMEHYASIFIGLAQQVQPGMVVDVSALTLNAPLVLIGMGILVNIFLNNVHLITFGKRINV